MKKLLVIIAAVMLTLTLAGCTKEVEVPVIEYVDREVEVEVEVEKELPVIPAEVTMADLDMYLGRPDVQYVDLRNFDDKMAAGYISGFEFIPFFDYLEYEGILVRTDGDWVFDADDIKLAAGLRALFNDDKTIFLMCGSGTRAGYVKAALEELGYDDVINVGGISTYLDGDAVNAVPGDDSYTINMDKKGPYTPGTYFGIDGAHGYTAVVVVGPAGAITTLKFDAIVVDLDIMVDELEVDPDEAYVTLYKTKQNLGFDYNMVNFGATYEWFQHADMLADAIIAAQMWDADWAIIPGVDGGHDKFDVTDPEVIDDLAGVTIGIEGFYAAFMDAISQAE
jgi:rhodanese-related sulfurtransferase